MNTRRNRTRTTEWPGREVWPFLVLLAAVLVPTGLLVWFMTDAINREAARGRQAAFDAYRSQIRVLRTRVDPFAQAWTDRLASGRQPANSSRSSPAQVFERLVIGQRVDGALVLDTHGRVLFPDLVSRERHSTGDRSLMAVQLLGSVGSIRTAKVTELSSLLNNYGVAMPSSQRLFLMGELRRSEPDIRFETEDALRLSTRVLESGPGRFEPATFRPTDGDDAWTLATPDRQVVGLFRTESLRVALEATFAPLMPTGVRFVAYPPRATGDREAIAAGPSLPGWQLSFVVDDEGLGTPAGGTRLFAYSWMAMAGAASLALVGVLAGQSLRRQVRLARLKTDLTAAVSHELRAPLASVQVLVDGLLADREIDPVKTREYLQLIASEQARLTRVIENFLSFARLERGRERFALEPTRPSEIVSMSVDAVRDRLPADGGLRVDVEDGLPDVRADANALVTALVNLLDNAIKFTPARKDVQVRVHQDGRNVAFAVRDNGPGIPAGEQRRIFKRFYRVDQRLARETAGVGLGLSIVQMVMRAHGGSVDVASEPGAGSTFTLRVPIAEGGVR